VQILHNSKFRLSPEFADYCCGVEREAGVYMLWSGSTCLYVGQSVDLRRRVQSSILDRIRKVGSFDVRIYPTDTAHEAEILEIALIACVAPEWNKRSVHDEPVSDVAFKVQDALTCDGLLFRQAVERIVSVPLDCVPEMSLDEINTQLLDQLSDRFGTDYLRLCLSLLRSSRESLAWYRETWSKVEFLKKYHYFRLKFDLDKAQAVNVLKCYKALSDEDWSDLVRWLDEEI